jgi:hypothetical protein
MLYPHTYRVFRRSPHLKLNPAHCRREITAGRHPVPDPIKIVTQILLEICNGNAVKLWPDSTSRTASCLNSSVYRARVTFVICIPFVDCQLRDTFRGGKIASSDDGSLSASLSSPRERFGWIRKLRYVVGVALLRTANILKIRLGPSSGLRPHRIVAFRHTDTAVRTYWRFESKPGAKAKH